MTVPPALVAGGVRLGHDGRMADEKLQLTVTQDAERDRFEAVTDSGEVAGVAAYRTRGDRVIFTHTVVREQFEGHGVGSTLVAHALDAVRDAGAKAVAVCPFVQAFVARHHDWDDILVPVEAEDLVVD